VRVGIPADPQYENKILPVELGARTRKDYMIGTLNPEITREEKVIAELVG
jgi:threonylcarbamoyladenosine tRNA methylthiotransferase MtaB